MRATATVLEVADRGRTVTQGNDSLVADTEVVLSTRRRAPTPSRAADMPLRPVGRAADEPL